MSVVIGNGGSAVPIIIIGLGSTTIMLLLSKMPMIRNSHDTNSVRDSMMTTAFCHTTTMVMIIYYTIIVHQIKIWAIQT